VRTVLARLACCAALVAGAAGCDPCRTSERAQVTLTASFEGDPALSTTRSAFEDEAAADFAAWRAAIGDPSSAPAGSGVVVLQPPGASGGPGRQLLLSLPFPLAAGQSLPIASAVATQGRPTFSLVAPDDPFPLPTDAVGLWFIGGSTSEDLLAAREQSASGTATVIGVSPLRLHLTATVSYPPPSGRPAATIDGDVGFSATAAEICAG
jgi:hypothetical protein